MVGLLGGHTENRQNKDKGQKKLDQKPRTGASVYACKTVGAEAAGHVGHPAEVKDQGKDAGAGKSTEALRHDIADKFAGRHSAAQQYAKRHRRVDMAAGDVADTVGHAHDGKTEGQSRQQVAGAACRVAPHKHGGSAADQHQRKGSDKFRN